MRSGLKCRHAGITGSQTGIAGREGWMDSIARVKRKTPHRLTQIGIEHDTIISRRNFVVVVVDDDGRSNSNVNRNSSNRNQYK